MNKMARLVEVASNVLRVPEKTVRSRVMLLRKNSLWSSSGKGISVDSAPPDASNLLLSFLGGGLVTETAKTVRLLRKCAYVAPDKDAALPPIGLLAEFTHEHTLGDMLDALFAHWSERGPPVSLDSNLPFTCVSLEIERYSDGWDAELFLRRDADEKCGEERRHVTYEFLPNRVVPTSIAETALKFALQGEFTVIPPTSMSAASVDKQMTRAARRMVKKRGDLITSARVSECTFIALANCLSRPTHRVSRQPLGQQDKLAN